MKISHFIFLALISLFVASVACNSKKEEQPATEQNTLSPDGGSLSTAPPTTEATPTSGTSTEPHYKCPKNCEGGVGSAQGKCPVCGTDLVHNQAFHAQATTQPGSSPTTPITINPTNATAPGTSPTTAQQPAAQPAAAQNAKGDWHWVCSKACGGGAGAAGNCPKCGSTLAHNQAYHQQ